MSFISRIGLLSLLLFFAAGAWAQKSKKDAEEESFSHNYVEFKLVDLSLGEPQPHIAGLFASGFNGLLTQADVVGMTISEPTLGARLTEGYHFNKHFALEGSITYMGKTEMRAVTGSGDTFDITALYYGGNVQAVGMYPITKSLSAFAKAGLAYWQADIDTVGAVYTVEETVDGETVTRTVELSQEIGVPGGDDNGFELMLGVGFRMEINDSFTWSFSYDTHEVDGFDTDTAALGIGFKY